ncbi:MAG: Fe-S oxidoreductase [Euryarchaeota archaeon RBG_19FT_COMBO_56_21]|nr:MAG: Fe-S oxidoreductase [Euryarchaeota archaeon RBG_19FT_COMBO_56_21]
MRKLNEIEKDLYACLQCGYCRDTCPVHGQIGWESGSPRGKVYYLKQIANRTPMDRLLRRTPEITPEFVERVFQCTSCAACEHNCHVEIDFAHVWEEVKEWLIDQGYGPMEAHKKIREKVVAKRNPYDEPMEKRAAWLPPEIELSPNPEVVFFTGCTEAYRMQPLAVATAKLLDKAGVKFNVLGEDEWCCGSPLLRTGQKSVVRDDIAPHNVNAMEKRGWKTMVTACAGCFNTMKNDYPHLTGTPGYKLYHVSEYLEKLIKDGKLKFTKEYKKKIFYHDPCHLGRHAKVYDAPRNVLKAIPGVTLLETKAEKEESQCCGAGGGFKSAFNEMAESIAAERVKQAVDAGAEVIATSCPFCQVNLNAGAKKAGLGIKTMDVVQIALQAV